MEIAILSACITKPAIIMYVNTIGMHYVFRDPELRTIASYSFTQYYKNKVLPSYEHLKIKFPQIEKYDLKKYIDMPDLVDYVIPQIQMHVEEVLQQYKVAGKEMKRVLTILYDISFLVYQNNGHYITDNIEDRLETYQNEEVEYIPTGLTVLDTVIGGFTKNTLSIVLARTNIGKSFMLQNFAIAAAKNNYNVLLVSTEMDIRKIIKRIDAAITDTDMNMLKYKRKEDIEKALTKIHGRLYLSQFPAAHLTVEELETYVEYVNTTLFPIDMLVLDYADELAIKNMTEFEGATHIFSYLRGIASKFNIAVVTATQGNRDTFESETISIAKVGRSYRGIAIADLVLGLAQTDEEYMNNEMRISVLKNRDNTKGQTVKVQTEFRKGKVIG